MKCNALNFASAQVRSQWKDNLAMAYQCAPAERKAACQQGPVPLTDYTIMSFSTCCRSHPKRSAPAKWKAACQQGPVPLTDYVVPHLLSQPPKGTPLYSSSSAPSEFFVATPQLQRFCLSMLPLHCYGCNASPCNNFSQFMEAHVLA